MSKRILFIVLFFFAFQIKAQDQKDEPAVTPVDLLQPGFFPDANFGMAVEDATDEKTPRVVTTGAEFVIDSTTATIECRQRIAKQRTVAKIQFPGKSLDNLKLAHKSSGAAIFTAGKTTIRINGDSLLQISPGESGDITATLSFTPDYFSQYLGCFNCFDPFGGISFFDHGQQDTPKVEALDDPVKITWNWKAGEVFWAGVSPPKPYDWNKSITQRIVYRGSSMQRYMYPDELTLKWLARVSKFNVLYLHAENVWINWQRDFTPVNEKEYLRVMQTANAEKLPVMVYASPKHFIEGTIVESRGRPDVDDPRAAGHNSGANAKIFVYQAKRLKERWETAGLYFDEMYCNRKAISAAYYVARSCRNIIGDDAPFMFHCTEDVISDRPPGALVGKTHCPTIHAYFDAIYKGEGVGMPGMAVTWENVDEKFPGYIRYNLGTYNISNVIAIPCLDRGPWIYQPLLDNLLKHANARVVMPEWFLYDERSVPYWTDYLPRMKPELKQKLEPTLLERTGTFDRWRKAQKASTQK
jgi:hypothetical protein